MLRALILIPALLAAPLFACCVFDNDALADEAAPWPLALNLIAGRAERQPSAYYEERLAAARADKLPGDVFANRLAEARALDQLNRQEEAISLLQVLLSDAAAGHLHGLVRSLLAQNFLHLWWRGEFKAFPEEVCLAQARLNASGLPDERYLLAILDWAEESEQAQPRSLLPDMFQLRLAGNKLAITSNSQLRERNLERAADVLLSLIELHPLWENFDTYYALSLIWAVDGRQPLAHFARLRAWELHEEGRTSRVPGIHAVQDIRSVTVMHRMRGGALVETLPVAPAYQERIGDFFTGMREYAKQWNKARAEYAAATESSVLAADFWADFQAPSAEPPTPPVAPEVETQAEPQDGPAAELTEPENGIDPETGRHPWLLLGALVALLSIGFVTHRRVSRKPQEGAK